MNTKIKQNKGVAGLTILLSLVVMLFIIGLIVMIFSLMSGQLQQATYTSTTGTKNNETLTTVTETGENFAQYSLRGVSCTVKVVTNATDGVVIPSSNYTQTNCNLKIKTPSIYNNTNWNVTYTYVYNADNTATDVINDTGASISTVTQWFDIFVVIGAMVVLILLTVIIISSIRSSGMIAGSNSGANSVGTA
jgi:hypothetical protein